MDKLALACVCVVKACVMKFLPDLGRLSLARPTGMQANAYASAQDEVTTLADLMALILTLTKKGDFRAACDAARNWGATAAGARDNQALWRELTRLVFMPINPDVHLLTQADINDGLDPRLWFFELCDRHYRLQEAEEHLKALKKRAAEHAKELRKVGRAMHAADAQDAMFPGVPLFETNARLFEKKYEELRDNINDPLHPGIPLPKQVLYARILVVRTKAAIAAPPSGKKAMRALNRMHEAYMTVFTPTTLEDAFGTNDDGPSEDDAEGATGPGLLDGEEDVPE